MRGDFALARQEFGFEGGFWILMREAQKDIAQVMEERTSVRDTAFASAIHDDIQAGAEATERDLALLDGRIPSDYRLHVLREDVGLQE